MRNEKQFKQLLKMEKIKSVIMDHLDDSNENLSNLKRCSQTLT